MVNLLFASGYGLARVFNIINTNIILVCSMYVWVFFFFAKSVCIDVMGKMLQT